MDLFAVVPLHSYRLWLDCVSFVITAWYFLMQNHVKVI
jgi:hypothetical protein